MTSSLTNVGVHVSMMGRVKHHLGFLRLQGMSAPFLSNNKVLQTSWLQLELCFTSVQNKSEHAGSVQGANTTHFPTMMQNSTNHYDASTV